MMAGRGFDISDEGFYVLSYRWWDSTPRVFTGVQYLYGPVFELLGWSIPGLRVVRLVSIVLVHLGLRLGVHDVAADPPAGGTTRPGVGGGRDADDPCLCRGHLRLAAVEPRLQRRRRARPRCSWSRCCCGR